MEKEKDPGKEQKLGHYARECWAGEGAKNKPNNRAHLAQDEGTDSDSEAVLLMAITSSEAQPRILIEEEENSNLHQSLLDQELFQDSTVNSEGALIDYALIIEAKPVEFDKVVTEEKWLKAMKVEINSTAKNQTWKLVDPPSNKKWITLKWVYKVKVNPKGEVVKYKARLVAKGFLQKAGIDYGEVYAPVARIEIVRLVIVIATNADWSMHQLNVKSAFLNGPLEEEQNNPTGTPVEVGLSLKKETNEEQVDPTHYRRIVGCLSNTRPNFNVSVGLVSSLLVGKRILRYVQGTVDFGILFPKGEAAAEPELISWSSTKEPVVALSSCKAEYIAAFETTCQAVWLDALLGELQEKNLKKVKLLIDNKSAIDLARHLASHGRSKHVETRFHFLREQVNSEKLKIEYCRIEIQFAVIFTKALKRERFRRVDGVMYANLIQTISFLLKCYKPRDTRTVSATENDEKDGDVVLLRPTFLMSWRRRIGKEDELLFFNGCQKAGLKVKHIGSRLASHLNTMIRLVEPPKVGMVRI
ncbi:Copia protein, partial [Mucuna pruriens]